VAEEIALELDRCSTSGRCFGHSAVVGITPRQFEQMKNRVAAADATPLLLSFHA